MIPRQLIAATTAWGLLATAAPAGAAQDATAWAQPVEYADDGHARVSDVAEGVARRGPFDAVDSLLRLNDLVREGDRLVTPTGSFLEIEISGGTFVRLGGDSTLVIQRLAEDVRVELVQGSVYLSRGADAPPTSAVAADRRVALDTRTIARIDHDPKDSRLSIYVDTGRTEVLGEDASVIVRASYVLEFTPEAGGPRVGDRPDDALASWNEERERRVRGYTQPQFVTDSHVGLYDLESSGSWVYVCGRWAWRPVVAVGWRPYLHGDWAWVDPYGWTWVPAARWGYVTHHYGRWHWTRGYGWVWLPGGYWAPAWVVWARFGVFFGWAPVDAYGRPVIVFSTVSYYDPRVWCFARHAYFHDRHGRPDRGRRDRDRHDRASRRTERPVDRHRQDRRIFTLADRDLRALHPEPLSKLGPVAEGTERKSARGDYSGRETAPPGRARQLNRRSTFDVRRVGRPDADSGRPRRGVSEGARAAPPTPRAVPPTPRATPQPTTAGPSPERIERRPQRVSPTPTRVEPRRPPGRDHSRTGKARPQRDIQNRRTTVRRRVDSKVEVRHGKPSLPRAGQPRTTVKAKKTSPKPKPARKARAQPSSGKQSRPAPANVRPAQGRPRK